MKKVYDPEVMKEAIRLAAQDGITWDGGFVDRDSKSSDTPLMAMPEDQERYLELAREKVRGVK